MSINYIPSKFGIIKLHIPNKQFSGDPLDLHGKPDATQSYSCRPSDLKDHTEFTVNLDRYFHSTKTPMSSGKPEQVVLWILKSLKYDFAKEFNNLNQTRGDVLLSKTKDKTVYSNMISAMTGDYIGIYDTYQLAHKASCEEHQALLERQQKDPPPKLDPVDASSLKPSRGEYQRRLVEVFGQKVEVREGMEQGDNVAIAQQGDLVDKCILEQVAPKIFERLVEAHNPDSPDANQENENLVPKLYLNIPETLVEKVMRAFYSSKIEFQDDEEAYHVYLFAREFTIEKLESVAEAKAKNYIIECSDPSNLDHPQKLHDELTEMSSSKEGAKGLIAHYQQKVEKIVTLYEKYIRLLMPMYPRLEDFPRQEQNGVVMERKENDTSDPNVPSLDTL